MRQIQNSSSSMSSSASAKMGDGSEDHQLFFVTSYSNFDKLAHGPRGTQAKQSVHIYKLDPSDGSLVLLNVQGDTVLNPAFTRYHPRLNVVYTCTEDIEEEGQIMAYQLSPDGHLTPIGAPLGAGGTSTCYLTIDREQKHMLVVNYWDSTLAVIPMDPTTGALQGPIKSMYDPKEGKKVVAAAKNNGGVNHSCNDASTIQQRQADPHSHALVLDPFVGTVAYVPDLGKDVIREFLYDPIQGKIVCELNMLPSGLCTGHPDGPRYIEFHPEYNIAYVVNELSSTVAIFEVDRALLQEIDDANRHNASIVADGSNGNSSSSDDKTPIDMNKFRGRSSFRLIQSISTLPSAFPNSMNTCGRICVHPSGRFVVVSNRGHQSVCVYKVKRSSSSNSGSSSGSSSSPSRRGQLQVMGYFHTRGETPRHFQFDHSGQYLLVANQDTDSLAVFSFNLSNGQLKYTGNEYRVPSPNFVCCCPTYQHDDEDEVDTGIAVGAVAAVAPASKIASALVTATEAATEPASSSGSSSKVLEVPPSSVDVVYRGHSMMMDGGDTSDSDDSTIRTNRLPRGHDKKKSGGDASSSLEEQLEKAQLEIEHLRTLLMQSRVESS